MLVKLDMRLMNLGKNPENLEFFLDQMNQLLGVHNLSLDLRFNNLECNPMGVENLKKCLKNLRNLSSLSLNIE